MLQRLVLYMQQQISDRAESSVPRGMAQGRLRMMELGEQSPTFS